MLKYATMVAMVAVACAEASNMSNATSEAPSEQERKVSDKLVITDEKIGDGAEAKAGQLVTVHYTGRLTDGTKFDSSVDRNQPFRFMLGVGQVIKGWDEGVVGMKIGGQRKLVIPAEKGYGARGAGAAIPPNATLEFDVELISVEG
ncbi:FKBP-type peptidyl-prolyl cis-trans isomerase [Candidatus Paracaedibacter acanthamoebae]|uniref:FKBP-type peptidyl-prolyl cis-trans isomerase n=1 Tax=Candidatus Odyssella acanthamoebae TaxID=91604 RepID=UPI000A02D6A6